MALAALIFASRQVEDGSRLPCAALPLAGATLLEHQVRRAMRAGATHIILHAEQFPGPLVEAIARLRGDGYRVDLARSGGEVADRIHPDETVLMIADGCIAGAETFDRIVIQRAPAVLVLPDIAQFEHLERIDGQTRWAGLALVEGRRLHETVALLGDWDLGLTLLRRALQAGALMVPSIEADGQLDPPLLVGKADDLASLEQRIIAGSAGVREGWPGRYLFPWIERPLIGQLARSRAEPLSIHGLAVLLAFASAVLAGFGFALAALAAALASGPVDSIARRLADIRMTRPREEQRLGQLRILALTCGLFMLGLRLGDDGQWGWPFMAVTVVGAMLALESGWRAAHRLDNRATMPLMASPDGLVLCLVPFGVWGHWGFGLMGLLLYALTSFVVAQRMVHDAVLFRLRSPQI